MKKVPVQEAIGLELCHDITKVVPGREKYRAYRRGQLITPADIPEIIPKIKAGRCMKGLQRCYFLPCSAKVEVEIGTGGKMARDHGS